MTRSATFQLKFHVYFLFLPLSFSLVSFESAFYVQNHEQFDLLWHKLFDPNNVVRSIFIHKRLYFSSFLLNTLDLIIGMAQCCQLLEKWIPFCAQFHRNWVTIFEYLKYRENWFRLKMFQFDCVAILICLFSYFFRLMVHGKIVRLNTNFSCAGNSNKTNNNRCHHHRHWKTVYHFQMNFFRCSVICVWVFCMHCVYCHFIAHFSSLFVWMVLHTQEIKGSCLALRVSICENRKWFWFLSVQLA